MHKSRLIVVDNLKNNSSAIAEDSYIEPTVILEDGHKITELWYCDKTPCEPFGKRDFLENFNFNIKPGALHFIKTIFPPFNEIKSYAKERACILNKETFGMHSTTTLDFAIVLKGEMEMHSENGFIKLNEGDCLVQKATIHGWINTGNEPAVMVFVMVGAHTPELFKVKSFEHPVSGKKI
ncbi:cupin domain-containing protein [Fluviispira multicolorata]|uniref:Cupin domain-containing protein n=1 Tax=Fluviispira multicolorata TaxID=2654512 RepID=A0A833N1B1_9BACT|nr:cupin domain-containing protein [Fluviispira multicolorata]KAB8030650.1 cupin domain-containing protein [Fluviispira multicolorata]